MALLGLRKHFAGPPLPDQQTETLEREGGLGGETPRAGVQETNLLEASKSVQELRWGHFQPGRGRMGGRAGVLGQLTIVGSPQHRKRTSQSPRLTG